MSDLTRLNFVAIGQNCWGYANNIYEAVKNAHENRYRESSNRYIVYLVSEDWIINEIDGAVSASEIHQIGWFNRSAGALKGRK